VIEPVYKDTLKSTFVQNKLAVLRLKSYSFNDSSIFSTTKQCVACPSTESVQRFHNKIFEFEYRIQKKRIFKKGYKLTYLIQQLAKDSIIVHELNLPKIITYSDIKKAFLVQINIKAENIDYAQGYLFWLNLKGELSYINKAYHGYVPATNTRLIKSNKILTGGGLYDFSGKTIASFSQAPVSEFYTLNDSQFIVIYDKILRKALDASMRNDETPFVVEPIDSQNIVIYNTKGKIITEKSFCPVNKGIEYIPALKKINTKGTFVYSDMYGAKIGIISIKNGKPSVNHIDMDKLTPLVKNDKTFSAVRLRTRLGDGMFYFNTNSEYVGYVLDKVEE
jgi:hypothetical protein